MNKDPVASAMDELSTKLPPHRRFYLSVYVEGDTRDDMVRTLNEIAQGIAAQSITPDAYAVGAAATHMICMREDPTMTHERYVEESDAFRRWVDMVAMKATR